MRRSLTRQERIHRSFEIRGLVSSARRIEGGWLRMAWRPNGRAVSRMAVIVARGCGGAVRRNREKRITREAWRTLKGRVPTGHDVVFIVHRFGLSYGERFSLMQRLLERADFREGIVH